MSGEGRPEQTPLDGKGLSVGIAATRWNSKITDQLLERALDRALHHH